MASGSKLKSHRGAAKRFKRTGSGKVKCGQSHARHILTKKSPKRKRQLRGTRILVKADAKSVNQMLPTKK